MDYNNFRSGLGRLDDMDDGPKGYRRERVKPLLRTSQGMVWSYTGNFYFLQNLDIYDSLLLGSSGFQRNIFIV